MTIIHTTVTYKLTKLSAEIKLTDLASISLQTSHVAVTQTFLVTVNLRALLNPMTHFMSRCWRASVCSTVFRDLFTNVSKNILETLTLKWSHIFSDQHGVLKRLWECRRADLITF